MTLRLALIIAAVVLFLVAAALSFGWFGSHANPGDVLGVGMLGLAAFAGGHV